MLYYVTVAGRPDRLRSPTDVRFCFNDVNHVGHVCLRAREKKKNKLIKKKNPRGMKPFEINSVFVLFCSRQNAEAKEENSR